MKPWAITDTRRYIEERFGRPQLSLVAPSLNSLAERLHYAQFHFQEIQRLLDSFTERHLAKKPLLIVIHGGDKESREDFEVLMIEVGAHATACVLSIHAISDIMANAAYLALGYNLDLKPLGERKISAASVQTLLRQNSAHTAFSEILQNLCNAPCYKHIAALANKSKHQNIVKPLLNEDFTGLRAQRHEFRFSTFQYGGKTFPEATLASVLEPIFSRHRRAWEYAQRCIGPNPLTRKPGRYRLAGQVA